MRRWLVALCAVVMVFSTAGCIGDKSANNEHDCTAGAPDGKDVTKPANNCFVADLRFTKPGVLPKRPAVGQVTFDLYIEGGETCLIGDPDTLISTGCGYDDNRPFVSAGSPDPHADITRTRVHVVADYATGDVSVRVSPSCRHNGEDSNGTPRKTCSGPRDQGDGTDLVVEGAGSDSVTLDLTVIQTNYGNNNLMPVLNGAGTVNNRWTLQTTEDGRIIVGGDGSGFPDLAVIHRGTVIYACQGTHLTPQLLPNGRPFRRSFDYDPDRPTSAYASQASQNCSGVPEAAPTGPSTAPIPVTAVWTGTWEGAASQVPPLSDYDFYGVSMELVSTPNTVVGTISYPDLGCQGRVQLVSSSDRKLELVEHIGQNNSPVACIDNGHIVMDMRDDGRAKWTWTASPEDSLHGGYTASATLTKKNT